VIPIQLVLLLLPLTPLVLPLMLQPELALLQKKVGCAKEEDIGACGVLETHQRKNLSLVVAAFSSSQV
jgi:hypothetical protein